MKFLFFVFVIALAIYVLFFCRFLIKRLFFFFQLKRICKQNGYTLLFCRKTALLGRRQSEKCDFHILMDHEVLSVKFFDAPIKMCDLHFLENRLYLFKYIIPLYRFCPPFEGKLKEFQNYDFSSGLNNELKHKKQTKILLCHPAPNDIYYKQRSGSLILCPGDKIPQTDLILFSSKAFLSFINKPSSLNI